MDALRALPAAPAGRRSGTTAPGMVIVSNRLPVRRGPRGWTTSPGGLVAALRPILRERESTWIGWAGAAGAAPMPFVHDRIRNRPVGLSREELQAYYEGFCNRTLWPLFHDAVRTPEYRRAWWQPYVAVNRRFADAAARAAPPGGRVWVQDYHLLLVPAMLRALRPDLRIGFFLHIPFPPPELFAQLPWRTPLLEGLLGADVVGFQTRRGARNFVLLSHRYAGTEGRADTLQYRDRTLRVGSFPISIDTARYAALAQSDAVARLCARYRARLGPGRRILLCVDRLDYTKGIDRRLRAFQELLRAGRLDPAGCLLLQVAVPSREHVAEYREQRRRIERLVGEINGQFGDIASTPVRYLRRSYRPEELVAMYRIADVAVVTPLRDGMNLVAKEYVAARADEDGVLVLSEFAGAASELRSALLVNPHDIDALAATMEQALHLEPEERRRRMRALRRVVLRHDVFRWARSFLEALQGVAPHAAPSLPRDPDDLPHATP